MALNENEEIVILARRFVSRASLQCRPIRIRRPSCNGEERDRASVSTCPGAQRGTHVTRVRLAVLVDAFRIEQVKPPLSFASTRISRGPLSPYGTTRLPLRRWHSVRTRLATLSRGISRTSWTFPRARLMCSFEKRMNLNTWKKGRIETFFWEGVAETFLPSKIPRFSTC